MDCICACSCHAFIIGTVQHGELLDDGVFKRGSSAEIPSAISGKPIYSVPVQHLVTNNLAGNDRTE